MAKVWRKICLNNEQKRVVAFLKVLLFLASAFVFRGNGVCSQSGAVVHIPFSGELFEHLTFLPFPTKPSDHENVGTYLSCS